MSEIGIMLRLLSVLLFVMSIALIGAWLETGVALVNPFAALLAWIFSPFCYLMGIAADNPPSRGEE